MGTERNLISGEGILGGYSGYGVGGVGERGRGERGEGRDPLRDHAGKRKCIKIVAKQSNLNWQVAIASSKRPAILGVPDEVMFAQAIRLIFPLWERGEEL